MAYDSIALAACQGDNELNGDAKCTHFADRFDGHYDGAVLYRMHPLMEEVHGFHKATKHHQRASNRSDITNWTHQHQLILTFHREKGSS